VIAVTEPTLRTVVMGAVLAARSFATGRKHVQCVDGLPDGVHFDQLEAAFVAEESGFVLLAGMRGAHRVVDRERRIDVTARPTAGERDPQFHEEEA